nr:MAG TPA: hypothetical protein [Caudoviricetes sp.]
MPHDLPGIECVRSYSCRRLLGFGVLFRGEHSLSFRYCQGSHAFSYRYSQSPGDSLL